MITESEAVDDHVVVLGADFLQTLAQHQIAVGHGNHFQLRPHQIEVGRNERQVLDGGLLDHVLRFHVSQQAFVDAAVQMIRIEPHAGSGVGLRVGVHQQHFVIQSRQSCAQVYGRGGLAYATFLVRYGNNFTHYLPKLSKSMSSWFVSLRSSVSSGGTSPVSIKRMVCCKPVTKFSKSSL